jgi:hypothetical protein
MKVMKNERTEYFSEYLERILPEYNMELDGSYILYLEKRFLWFDKPRKVAYVSSYSNNYNMELYDNNFLDEMTEILPPWEKLTGNTINVKLAKQTVQVNNGQ